MRRFAVIAAALVALAAAASASASEIVTRDASSVSLKVDRTGHAGCWIYSGSGAAYVPFDREMPKMQFTHGYSNGQTGYEPG